MKKMIVMPMLMMLFFMTIACNSEVETGDFTNATFKVYGNCEMCKKTIETAVKKVEGVKKAEWNVETKMINITFDDKKTSLTKIKEAIASVGYDTDDVRAKEEDYKGLHSCCQYKRPE